MEFEGGFADIERWDINILLSFLFVVAIGFDISVIDFGWVALEFYSWGNLEAGRRFGVFVTFDVGGLEEVGWGMQLVEGFGDGVEGELLGGGGGSCYFGWVDQRG